MACKSNIISEYIDEVCDCDYEFFRMMLTRYMNKTKKYILENKGFIQHEILNFHEYYIENVINNGGIKK